MSDAYKYDADGVTTVISTLKELTNRYKAEITRLNNLVDTINTSNSWKDVNVKTSFINTCNSYIKIYNGLANTMESYIKYLKNKSRNASSIDSAFMGG